MKPIQLTPNEEMLLGCPDKKGRGIYTRDGPEDEEIEMSYFVGLHELCGGRVYRHPASKMHDALTCRKCALRYIYPNTIRTFGQLREHAEKLLKWCK